MPIHLSRQRGGVWYARGPIRVGVHRALVPEFSTSCTDRAGAELVMRQVEEDKKREMAARIAAERSTEGSRKWPGRTILPGWAYKLWLQAKDNAHRRGILFDLSEHDLGALVLRANGRCEVSGVSFNFNRTTQGRRRPLAASIDRIRGDDGYSLGNCRLICCALNIAFAEWGEDAFYEIAAGMVKSRQRRERKIAKAA